MQGEVGLMDVDRLIEPDATGNRQAHCQPRDDEPTEHEQRGDVARVGLAPPGQAAAWAEALSLTGAAETLHERLQRPLSQRLDGLDGTNAPRGDVQRTAT